MPIYAFKCLTCGEVTDELIRSESDNLEGKTCKHCSRGLLTRSVADEGFSVPGSEIGFEPYFDVGAGEYFKSREDQTRVYKEKGLVPLTRREVNNRIDNRMRNPKPKYEWKQDKFEAAFRKGVKKVKEKNKLVINTGSSNG